MTIVCEILPGGRSVRLIKDLIVRDDDGTTIRVPAGFVSDFASVPRIFWRVAPPWGPYSEAAVVHDWLYRTGYPRAEADATFRRLMARAGVRFPLRWAMWVAVRAFGWMHWRRVGVAVAAVLCLSSAGCMTTIDVGDGRARIGGPWLLGNVSVAVSDEDRMMIVGQDKGDFYRTVEALGAAGIQAAGAP